MHSKVKVSIY